VRGCCNLSTRSDRVVKEQRIGDQGWRGKKENGTY